MTYRHIEQVFVTHTYTPTLKPHEHLTPKPEPSAFSFWQHGQIKDDSFPLRIGISQNGNFDWVSANITERSPWW